MSRSKVTRSQAIVGVIAFAGAAVVGGITAASASSSGTSNTPSSTSTAPPKLLDNKGPVATGVTPDGRTYGSRLDVAQGKEPDLIAVIGDNLKAGYVDRVKLDSLDGPKDSALRDQGKLSVPVYAEDGVTQIDTFTVGDRFGFVTRYNGKA